MISKVRLINFTQKFCGLYFLLGLLVPRYTNSRSYMGRDNIRIFRGGYYTLGEFRIFGSEGLVFLALSLYINYLVFMYILKKNNLKPVNIKNVITFYKGTTVLELINLIVLLLLTLSMEWNIGMFLSEIIINLQY